MTTTTHIGGIRAVSIPVTDQDAALRFYVEHLDLCLARVSGGR